MISTPYFETSRLIVRRFTPDDIDALSAYRNDAETARWQAWTLPYERETAAQLVAEMAAPRDLERGTWTQLAVEGRAEGRLVGDFGVHLDEAGRGAELGYTFAPGARGRGYATEGLRALVDYLFIRAGVEALEAWTGVHNAPSRALLDRVGFRTVEIVGEEAHYALTR
jgi:RimJ/RimL family protein N-acetyltransferase